MIKAKLHTVLQELVTYTHLKTQLKLLWNENWQRMYWYNNKMILKYKKYTLVLIKNYNNKKGGRQSFSSS